MADTLAIGLILGLAAGISPGPLLMLVISETLRHGTGAGVRVALSPLITDLPIILVTVLLLSRLSDYQAILGLVSLLGGCFILYLGYESLRARDIDVGDKAAQRAPRSLAKGILTNALNPNPYLFWIGVGAPTLTKATAAGPAAPALFLLGFYGLLVGSKVLLALVVGRTKGFLNGPLYRYTLRLLGLVLCGLALGFFHEGLGLLGLLEHGSAFGAYATQRHGQMIDAQAQEAVGDLRLPESAVEARVDHSIDMVTCHASSKSNFFRRNTTGAVFISSMPLRMRALSSGTEATRIWRRKVRAIFEKAHSIRLSQEPCLGV